MSIDRSIADRLSAISRARWPVSLTETVRPLLNVGHWWDRMRALGDVVGFGGVPTPQEIGLYQAMQRELWDTMMVDGGLPTPQRSPLTYPMAPRSLLDIGPHSVCRGIAACVQSSVDRYVVYCTHASYENDVRRIDALVAALRAQATLSSRTQAERSFFDGLVSAVRTRLVLIQSSSESHVTGHSTASHRRLMELKQRATWDFVLEDCFQQMQHLKIPHPSLVIINNHGDARLHFGSAAQFGANFGALATAVQMDELVEAARIVDDQVHVRELRDPASPWLETNLEHLDNVQLAHLQRPPTHRHGGLHAAVQYIVLLTPPGPSPYAPITNSVLQPGGTFIDERTARNVSHSAVEHFASDLVAVIPASVGGSLAPTYVYRSTLGFDTPKHLRSSGGSNPHVNWLRNTPYSFEQHFQKFHYAPQQNSVRGAVMLQYQGLLPHDALTDNACEVAPAAWRALLEIKSIAAIVGGQNGRQCLWFNDGRSFASVLAAGMSTASDLADGKTRLAHVCVVPTVRALAMHQALVRDATMLYTAPQTMAASDLSNPQVPSVLTALAITTHVQAALHQLVYELTHTKRFATDAEYDRFMSQVSSVAATCVRDVLRQPFASKTSVRLIVVNNALGGDMSAVMARAFMHAIDAHISAKNDKTHEPYLCFTVDPQAREVSDPIGAWFRHHSVEVKKGPQDRAPEGFVAPAPWFMGVYRRVEPTSKRKRKPVDSDAPARPEPTVIVPEVVVMDLTQTPDSVDAMVVVATAHPIAEPAPEPITVTTVEPITLASGAPIVLVPVRRRIVPTMVVAPAVVPEETTRPAENTVEMPTTPALTPARSPQKTRTEHNRGVSELAVRELRHVAHKLIPERTALYERACVIQIEQLQLQVAESLDTNDADLARQIAVYEALRADARKQQRRDVDAINSYLAGRGAARIDLGEQASPNAPRPPRTMLQSPRASALLLNPTEPSKDARDELFLFRDVSVATHAGTNIVLLIAMHQDVVRVDKKLAAPLKEKITKAFDTIRAGRDARRALVEMGLGRRRREWLETAIAATNDAMADGMGSAIAVQHARDSLTRVLLDEEMTSSVAVATCVSALQKRADVAASYITNYFKRIAASGVKIKWRDTRRVLRASAVLLDQPPEKIKDSHVPVTATTMMKEARSVLDLDCERLRIAHRLRLLMLRSMLARHVDHLISLRSNNALDRGLALMRGAPAELVRALARVRVSDFFEDNATRIFAYIQTGDAVHLKSPLPRAELQVALPTLDDQFMDAEGYERVQQIFVRLWEQSEPGRHEKDRKLVDELGRIVTRSLHMAVAGSENVAIDRTQLRAWRAELPDVVYDFIAVRHIEVEDDDGEMVLEFTSTEVDDDILEMLQGDTMSQKIGVAQLHMDAGRPMTPINPRDTHPLLVSTHDNLVSHIRKSTDDAWRKETVASIANYEEGVSPDEAQAALQTGNILGMRKMLDTLFDSADELGADVQMRIARTCFHQLSQLGVWESLRRMVWPGKTSAQSVLRGVAVVMRMATSIEPRADDDKRTDDELGETVPAPADIGAMFRNYSIPNKSNWYTALWQLIWNSVESGRDIESTPEETVTPDQLKGLAIEHLAVNAPRSVHEMTLVTVAVTFTADLAMRMQDAVMRTATALCEEYLERMLVGYIASPDMSEFRIDVETADVPASFDALVDALADRVAVKPGCAIAHMEMHKRVEYYKAGATTRILEDARAPISEPHALAIRTYLRDCETIGSSETVELRDIVLFASCMHAFFRENGRSPLLLHQRNATFVNGAAASPDAAIGLLLPHANARCTLEYAEWAVAHIAAAANVFMWAVARVENGEYAQDRTPMSRPTLVPSGDEYVPYVRHHILEHASSEAIHPSSDRETAAERRREWPAVRELLRTITMTVREACLFDLFGASVELWRASSGFSGWFSASSLIGGTLIVHPDGRVADIEQDIQRNVPIDFPMELATHDAGVAAMVEEYAEGSESEGASESESQDESDEQNAEDDTDDTSDYAVAILSLAWPRVPVEALHRTPLDMAFATTDAAMAMDPLTVRLTDDERARYLAATGDSLAMEMADDAVSETESPEVGSKRRAPPGDSPPLKTPTTLVRVVPYSPDASEVDDETAAQPMDVVDATTEPSVAALTQGAPVPVLTATGLDDIAAGIQHDSAMGVASLEVARNAAQSVARDIATLERATGTVRPTDEQFLAGVAAESVVVDLESIGSDAYTSPGSAESKLRESVSVRTSSVSIFGTERGFDHFVRDYGVVAPDLSKRLAENAHKDDAEPFGRDVLEMIVENAPENKEVISDIFLGIPALRRAAILTAMRKYLQF